MKANIYDASLDDLMACPQVSLHEASTVFKALRTHDKLRSQKALRRFLLEVVGIGPVACGELAGRFGVR